MKVKKNNLIEFRNIILNEVKQYVSVNGWSDNIIEEIPKNGNFSKSELITLFPKGYKQILNMYLNELNKKLLVESKKFNFENYRTHEKIRELIILKLKIMSREKNLISKTFFNLLLPNNFNTLSKALYKSVDQIWFIAKDQSTDFNFYSKRAILAWIYSLVVIHFINNNDINETIKILDKNLKDVSKIPKVKKNIKESLSIIPNFFELITKNNFVKR